MSVLVARTAPRWTVRGATVCHDGRCMPPRTSGRAVPRHVPLGEPRSDAWAGELVRGSEVANCRGKWLAAVVVFLRLRACRSSGLAGARSAPRRASLGVPGSAFPTGSSRRGLGALARSSRQAPLAGALPPWPGKFLLPRPRLLGPTSSSCRGPCLLVLNAWSSLGPKRGRGDSWRSPGKPCRGVLQLPVHKFGVLRYPYFSTPTYTVKHSPPRQRRQKLLDVYYATFFL